ncbi:ROK family protein [Actinomarinicola tropica]|uniref:ROK family protein n=1 Tax=Actinomarinicola tropica TaxID=2789776 RepID=A0A5Q2RFF3_9ACTN|nr:ROK family protein [Actinomarinicola tropica]QGG95559.1 ROK family protein [Actinomarinicola tropica]
MTTVLAIDIGGTKMDVGLVDLDGRVLRREVRPTPAAASAAELWATLCGALDAVGDVAGAVALGVGCGGPMAPGGVHVSPLNIPGWRAFPLRARLAERTGLAVHVDNDAKALALAEGWRGAATGVRDYMAMVVSTGVGGGIVLDGRLLDGAGGNAGHVGHVIVEPDGDTMPGHAQGTLEGEASGLAIARRTGRPAAEADAETVARVGRVVGRGAASVCNLLDLRLVVVAGSVALGYGEPFFRAAQAEMDRLCLLDFSRGARIVPAGLGADGPLVGAAAVALRGQGTALGIA